MRVLSFWVPFPPPLQQTPSPCICVQEYTTSPFLSTMPVAPVTDAHVEHASECLRAVIAVALPLEQLKPLSMDSRNMLIDALEPIVNEAERVFGDMPHALTFLFQHLRDIDVPHADRKEWNLRRRRRTHSTTSDVGGAGTGAGAGSEGGVARRKTRHVMKRTRPCLSSRSTSRSRSK